MPLTPEQTDTFIREMLRAGVSSERIESELKLVSLTAAKPETRPGRTETITIRGRQITRPVNLRWGQAARGLGVPALTALGGAGGFRVAGQPGATVGEALGGGAGELLAQAVERLEGTRGTFDLGAAAETGVVTGAAGGALRLGAKAGGRLGGVPSRMVERVEKKTPLPTDVLRTRRGFRLTFGQPKDTAELALQEKIRPHVAALRDTVTAGRATKEAILAQHGDVRASVEPIIDKLKEHYVAEPILDSAKIANRRIETAIKNLQHVEATGGMKLTDLDVFLSKQLDPAIFRGSKASQRIFGRALSDARDIARETLLSNLPPEAREATRQAFLELKEIESIERVFKKQGPFIRKLRTMFEPGNEDAVEALRKLSEKSGVPLLDEAEDLATKRHFTFDDRRREGALKRMFYLTGIPQLAFYGAKVGAPLQRFAAPTAGIIKVTGKRKETNP